MNLVLCLDDLQEATYGTHIHEPREARESRFTRLVHDIVNRGGRCLIPVFALGRAQELLLILGIYSQLQCSLLNWRSVFKTEVIYVSQTSIGALIQSCTMSPSTTPLPLPSAAWLFTRRILMPWIRKFNAKSRTGILSSSSTFPTSRFDTFTYRNTKWALLYVNYIIFCYFSQSIEHFEDIGPSVVMASPGMMQSGLSRELFESWCTDKRNGTIIAGYCVEGTLAKVQLWHVVNKLPCFLSVLKLDIF